jgi:hypothetical protein
MAAVAAAALAHLSAAAAARGDSLRPEHCSRKILRREQKHEFKEHREIWKIRIWEFLREKFKDIKNGLNGPDGQKIAQDFWVKINVKTL